MADGFSTQSNQHADERAMMEKGFQQVVQSLGQQKQLMQPILDWITACMNGNVTIRGSLHPEGFIPTSPKQHDNDDTDILGDRMEDIRLHPTGTERQHSPPSAEGSITVYEVNPSVTTIDQVWEEWYNGLKDGPNDARSPSLQWLESEHGTKWRRQSWNQKRFLRRQTIAKRMDLAAQRLGITNRQAAQVMELWRKQRKFSLDKLSKTISKKPDLFGVNDDELRLLL